GDRELNPLVASDRLTKDTSVSGIGRRTIYEPSTVTDALRGDEDALGVHGVQNVPKAVSLRAHKTPFGNLQVVEEELVGLVVDHRFQRFDREPTGIALSDVDEEQGEPGRSASILITGCGAGQKQKQVRLLGARGEHLLAVDDKGLIV